MKKIFASLLIVSMLIPLCAFALQPVSDNIYNGIDISEFQGEIDFAQVKADGKEAVYIRAGFGMSADPFLRRNYSGAKANEMYVGFYHYVTADTPAEASAQAEYFVNLTSGLNPDMRYAMDYEQPNSEAAEIALEFLETVERITGTVPAIYSDAYNARDYFSEIPNKYPLWVAEYGTSEPEDNGNWAGWSAWQYSDMGEVAGISDNVDLDYYTDNMLLSGGEEEYFLYTVVQGDTLYSLARRFGTTIDAIAAANNIANVNLIYVNEVLRIPDSGTVIYTVVRGDTLYSIARRFGTTIARLVQQNGISNPNLIYPGQRLIISRQVS